MGKRTCIVCGKEVPQGYETDHLRANHLGPHTFWFDAKKFQTMEPSMLVADIKKMVAASPLYPVCEDRGGREKDIWWSDGVNVDLTHEPHFFAVPPASYY